MGESIWSKTVEIEEREFLRGENRTEIAVIGGGLAGLLTAYFLQKRGKKVVVLEANRIGSGQTRNTTAKITSQHGLIYDKLCKKYGEARARLYARAHQEAIEQYADLIQKEGFSCHFERLPSVLYSETEEEALRKEAEAAKKLGIPAYFTKKAGQLFQAEQPSQAEQLFQAGQPFSVKGAVVFENQAQFHPLEFVKQLSEKLTVYERTNVLKVKGHYLETNHGSLYADKVVFAAHYPFINVPGFYFLRQHQERSYVLALSGTPKVKGMFYSEDEDGLSFRWYEDILLLGGGGHRTGTVPKKQKQPLAEDGKRKGGQEQISKEIPKEYGYAMLCRRARELFPDGEAVAEWSAQDCVPQDDLPFIGSYSIFRPYWYVATGFKKWGMTGAMVSARLICGLICGEKPPYASLFSPRRFPFHASAKKLRKDLKFSIVGLTKGHFHWPLGTGSAPERGEARILRVGLKRYGVYRDEGGELHKVSIKCPHLGCELAWNQEEKTWDCPCHGSRFDYNGNLLDGPAQKGIFKG